MAIILSLDSTTSVCSIAIHRNKQLIHHEINIRPRAAAAELAGMIENAIAATSINRQEISAIAVSSGPGSYTGLRISTSTAKGLSLALSVPLIAVDSLSVLTKQAIELVSADLYCPMIDARRMEVYFALLNHNLEFIKPIGEMMITSDSFQKEIENSTIAFFGDGSEKFKKLTNHQNRIFVDDIQPSAKDLGTLAYERFESKNFENLDQFEPFYLKDFYFKKSK